MQLLSRLFLGLFVSCIWFSWGSRGDFSVLQTPSNITVSDGEDVQITCCWNINITQMKVKWFKDDPIAEVDQSDGRLHTEIQRNCSVLSIRNTCRNHSGVYFCEVTQEIPILITVKGDKTTVEYQSKNDSKTTVSTPSPTPETPPGPLSSSVLMPVSVSSALVLICLCMSLIVWRACKKSERVIIREGPPSEEEEPENSEEDSDSRNSRGSTQWYMVPVYESYFDLQRNDEEMSSKEELAAKSDKSK